MAETSELLPCPLCNETPILRRTTRDDESAAPRPHNWYVIECEHCDLRLERESNRWWSSQNGSLPETSEDNRAKALVIAAWNRRPSPHPIEGAVSDEAVEAAARAIATRVLGRGDTTGVIRSIVNDRWREWEKDARVALTAALPHLHPSPDNTGEAVAWRWTHADEPFYWNLQKAEPSVAVGALGIIKQPLYLHPPAADAVVEVKPLEWKEFADGEHRTIYNSFVPFNYGLKRNGGWWTLAVDIDGIPRAGSLWESLERGKIAAQDDFTKRIRSALSTRQQAGDGEC